jgi:hypothetical protein
MSDTPTVRLAYFITSYGAGPQLDRLVRTLRRGDPDAAVVVHHDPSTHRLDPDLFADLPDVHLLTAAEPIIWGDITLEAARWRVFRWILDNLDVDWVMLLSEQDYPVAPAAELHAHLAGGGADAYLYGMPIADIGDDELRRECEKRYLYQYVSLPSSGIERRLPGSWQRRLKQLRRKAFGAVARLQRQVLFYATPEALDLPSRIGLRARRTPFDADFPCWLNDSWFAASRTALTHLLDHLDAHPELVRYYERTVIPLESATATVLLNDPTLTITRTSFHEIRWTDPRSGRPDVFTTDDVDHLLTSGAYFARKFGSADIEVLDRLDAMIFGPAR